MAKTRERLKKWEETQNSVDYLCQILEYYFRTYQSNFGKAHPPLRPEHVKRVCVQLLSYGFDVEEYCDMIDRYLTNQTMVTDHNILHFVEDEIIINRAYESGMGMSDIV